MSAALVVAGMALFSIAFAGLEELRRTPMPEYTSGMPIEQLSRYYRLSAMSWGGLASVALGIGVGVYGWLRHRAAVRRGG